MVAVVDDDAPVRTAFKRLLQASGWTAATFGSGEEFLAELCQDRPPACVVLDIHLGGMTGFEVHAALGRANVRIPVIFVTAYDDSTTRANLREVGEAACLFKPVDEATLIDAVTRAADESGQP